jgi:glycosyltransferase involved in cell wall biosynthesis
MNQIHEHIGECRRLRRIVIDETHLRRYVTGLERVTIELFSDSLFASKLPTQCRIERVYSHNLPSMLFAQLVRLPLRALFDRDSLMVFPGFPPCPLALVARDRCAIYIHDTFLLTRTADLNWRAWIYMRPMFAAALRHGRVFFCNSEATARSVREYCPPQARISLLRPPVRDVFGIASLPVAPAPMPLRILAIGTIEPRKNYPAAIAIVQALNAAGIAAELHIVGRRGWGRHDYLDDAPPFVKIHGYIDDAALRELVAICHVFLSTSFAEGLGLPLLEIQHGGLPVVAPTDPTFTEVLGESGILIDPKDPASAADKIASIALSPDRLAAARLRSRFNVARWNDLAARDAERFRSFIADGPTALDRI